MTGVSGSDNDHFDRPRQMAVDDSGLLYVADANNHRCPDFRCLRPGGHYLHGHPGHLQFSGSDNDHFDYPIGVAVSGSRIFVADSSNHRVQVFNRTTRAYEATVGTGSSGTGNSQFNFTVDVAVDAAGNLYVTDWGNHRVQKFDNSLAYQSTYGTTGVPYLTDGFHYRNPLGMAVDAVGNIYLSEEWGERLVKLDKDGLPQWTVGEAGVSGSDNAHFSRARGVAVDSRGNVYIADHDNSRIQVFDSSGVYTATIGGVEGDGDYELSYASGVAIGPGDMIYVADTWNHRVQVFDSSRTYVGTIGTAGVIGDDNDHFESPHGYPCRFQWYGLRG